ncbi:MAG: sigma-54-dependent transcriptional regulator [Ignavibacterium sp.]
MSKEYSILIIDDEQSQREVLKGYLEKKNFRVITASSGSEGLDVVNKEQVDIVLSDYKMPDKTGIEVLEEVKRINPEISFVLMTAYGTIENAVKAMRLGAYDYLSKPIDLDELELLLEKIIENKNLKSEISFLKQQLQEKFKIDSFVSSSPKMQEVLSVAARAAESKATVLITGESGTGKEVLAKSIHYISSRKDKPFVAVNVPALPETLLESELFGHEKGAFTGALQKTKMGKFELASGGTILLDEIAELSPEMQAKLLRVLQEKKYFRLGGEKEIEVDVRVLAATNKKLEDEVKKGNFREDLFYRLNVGQVTVPPLRERKEDIPFLAYSFLQEFAKKFDKQIKGFDAGALEILTEYPWKGNIRELRNVIERVTLLLEEDEVKEKHLHFLKSGVAEASLSDDKFVLKIPAKGIAIDVVLKKLIEDTLRITNGNQVRAAKILGLSRSKLRYRMEQLGIEVTKNIQHN